MSAGKCFFDTNVFLYAVDRSDDRKQAVASELIETALLKAGGVISYQIVQEFVNVCLRKFPGPMSRGELLDYLQEVFKPMLVVESSLPLFQEALAIHGRYKLSWYDSLIVAAAIQAECTVLYTEDLQHGQRLGDLRVTNPFL